MTTCYAGLWYLSSDIGKEAKTILFIVILSSNALFGVLWITAYLGNVEWATKWVKMLRVEKSYIKSSYITP